MLPVYGFGTVFYNWMCHHPIAVQSSAVEGDTAVCENSILEAIAETTD